LRQGLVRSGAVGLGKARRGMVGHGMARDLIKKEKATMQDTKLYPLWKEAIKVFIETSMGEPGTVITEEWKLEHFGLKKPKMATVEEVQKFNLILLSTFESFREELLTEYQIHLKPAGRGAHIVLAPGEQTSDAWRQGVNDIKKSMSKMRQRLTNVSLDQLTLEERKENADALARMSLLAGMFRKARTKELD